MAQLGKDFFTRADAALSGVDHLLATKFSGDFGGRQPIHTCYVPADKISKNITREWADVALATLEKHAPSPAAFASAIGVAPSQIEEIWDRIKNKIASEPIEDLRIDFEDGYGRRSDVAEDADLSAALSAFPQIKTPFIGIRIKSMEAVTRQRGLKTLDQFISGLAKLGTFPNNFVITLPKVTFPEQVEVLVLALEELEKSNKLRLGSLRLEIQIETTQAIFGPDGLATAAALIDASAGRLNAFHYGTYDYSAAAGISSAYQTLDHPAADYAKSLLQVVTAGTTVRLSDGSTNILPLGETTNVHAAMKNHYRLVRRALERGFYQGWDLHGSQLPTRIAANFIFYRDGLSVAANRLLAYLDKAESGTMDEPATALTLARYFLRGLDSGAIAVKEMTTLTNQSEESLRALVLNRGVI